ncbi:cytochrome o ubiquinol oxidase subunit 3 [Enhydrobacter aerosaccus]|uniref:Cytochrome bo(3) ubiquinol oxidase subunit 3 n=1 Tax=Enhydrobacter aerosaccus TaxID=225324 RepID=A0A1T4RW94_9HYPH|nr:cytochrome o ubiquinol oxidase subunit III [Enhydrobacter aerosaccus]SKA20215.1 cytochrome o ubiquinol oxidase subunit 3 [Enhydrobacter aerosaccus]
MSLVDTLTTPAEGDVPLSERGPAAVDVVVGFGFWLFLLSDIVIFGSLFAAYAVLAGQTDGGPDGQHLFDRANVLIETGCLLASSFTCGLFSLAIERRAAAATYLWAAVTFAFGAAFLGLELSEFIRMIGEGAAPTRSAFLSAFFTLVGTHGLHVTLGLCWLAVMVAQIATLGFRPHIVRRLFCFSLFWHALDIVWIGVFTIVYLGAAYA